MAILGPTKLARKGSMAVLARVATSFDLLAMQEVGSNASSAGEDSCVAVMDFYVSSINTLLGQELYAYVRGNQYAFVYRKDRLKAQSWGLYSGPQHFTYTPLVARFQVEGRPLDFIVITVHTRPSLARSEIPALALAMSELASSLGEADVLCAGDFNGDGGYYPEGPGEALAGFPSASFLTVIPNEADTTVAEDSLAYDRIELSASMKEDYTGRWGVLKPGSLFDLSACEGSADSAGGERALSDHYPVWAELSTVSDSD